MFNKLFLFMILVCSLSFCFMQSSDTEGQIVSPAIGDESDRGTFVAAVNSSNIKITADNIRKQSRTYLVDIYARNVQSNIAGIQLELIGEDFKIVEAMGGLAEKAEFNFYNGARGVVLAFSLQGKTISKAENQKEPLLTLKVVKNNFNSAEFNLKTLIAGERGIKLESTFTPVVID